MNSSSGTLKVFTLLIVVSLLVSSFGIPSFSKDEGRLLSKDYPLNCEEHGYLYRSSKDYTNPPNKTCRKRYSGHLYYVAEIAGEPVTVREMSALVTGGPSDLGKAVEGFRLEVLTSVGFRKSGGAGGYVPTKENLQIVVALLSERDPWETLTTFAAPCAGEKSVEVSWQGDPIEIIAVRIVAPEKHFVDHTQLGPVPGDENELKESGGWMKIMGAPGHADYVKN